MLPSVLKIGKEVWRGQDKEVVGVTSPDAGTEGFFRVPLPDAGPDGFLS